MMMIVAPRRPMPTVNMPVTAPERKARVSASDMVRRAASQVRTFARTASIMPTNPVSPEAKQPIRNAMPRPPAMNQPCETAVTTGLVMVMGEITTSTYVDIGALVREVVTDIGYTRGKYGFDAETCGVLVSIKEQSADIAMGVDEALEHKSGEMSDEAIEALGAGDQGVMVGFACNETPELMPMPISLAHGLTKRLAYVRKNGTLPYLRPDGKSQVTVEYAYGRPKRVDTVVISTQHSPTVEQHKIKADLFERVIKYVVPNGLLDDKTKIYINPTGRFVIGGPMGDAGVTGRKIIVDTYGGIARHGGGAFSGKDATKVDRSGAYMARYIAKNCVAAGLADRLELQISYAIGVARPLSVSVETFGTGNISDQRIIESNLVPVLD